MRHHELTVKALALALAVAASLGCGKALAEACASSTNGCVQVEQIDGADSTSQTITLDNNVQAGNAIISSIRCTSNAVPTSASLNTDGGMTELNGGTAFSPGSGVSVLAAYFIASAGGSRTITWSVDMPLSCRLQAFEYTGTSHITSAGTTLSTSTTPTATNLVTPSAAGLQVIEILAVNGGSTIAPNDGSTEQIEHSDQRLQMQDLLSPSTSPMSPSWSLGTSQVTTAMAIILAAPAAPAGGLVHRHHRGLLRL